jgi:hypothetical protein
VGEQPQGDRWKRARELWWFLTLVLLAAYAFDRWPDLHRGKPDALDLLLFVVLIGIWLLPLATEVRIWGFQLKREVHKLRKDVAGLQQTLSMSQAVNVNTFDPKLLEAALNGEKKQGGAGQFGAPRVSQTPPEDPPAQAQLAFATRYQIDKEISRLVTVAMKRRKHEAVGLLGQGAQLHYLEESGLIDANLASATRQVSAAASQEIHGHALDPAGYAVFREGAQFVLGQLRAITE